MIKVVTFNAFAYKADYHGMEAIERGACLPNIWDFEPNDPNYTQIGTAVVTVTLLSKEELHNTQLTALNKALDNVRAENQVRENAILDRISKLTAIGHDAINDDGELF
jgi:hypothetical protein